MVIKGSESKTIIIGQGVDLAFSDERIFCRYKYRSPNYTLEVWKERKSPVQSSFETGPQSSAYNPPSPIIKLRKNDQFLQILCSESSGEGKGKILFYYQNETNIR